MGRVLELAAFFAAFCAALILAPGRPAGRRAARSRMSLLVYGAACVVAGALLLGPVVLARQDAASRTSAGVRHTGR
jgi:Tfp pilus assembly protein PilN